jgi:hypothetical protein
MVQFIHMVITVSYSNRHVSMLLFQINARNKMLCDEFVIICTD